MRLKLAVVALVMASSSSALAADDYSAFDWNSLHISPAFGVWGGPFVFNADLYGSNFTVSGNFQHKYPGRGSFGVTPSDHPDWLPKPHGDNPPPKGNPPPNGNPPPGDNPPTGDNPPSNGNPPPDVYTPPGDNPPPPSIITFDDPPPSDPPDNHPSGNPPCDPPGGNPVVTPAGPVPEPATWISMFLGFGMLGLMLRAPLRRAQKA